MHLQVERCPTCSADYTRQLRYLRSARFHDKVAALLPAPDAGRARRAPAAARRCSPTGPRALLGHERTGTAAQLAASGAGRGLGDQRAALKLAAFCTGGAGTLGACVATGVLPLPRASTPPARRQRATADRRRRRPERGRATASRALPHGAVTATPTPTPTPDRNAPARPHEPRHAVGQDAGRDRSAQPRASARRRRRPPTPRPGGASEFDPTYQAQRTRRTRPGPGRAREPASSSDPSRKGAPDMSAPRTSRPTRRTLSPR